MHVESIKPNLMVHAKKVESPGDKNAGSGVHIGTVDHLDGDRYIKLKKTDAQDGQHHWIPVEWVEDVDDKAVYLSKTPDEVLAGLLNENPQYRH